MSDRDLAAAVGVAGVLAGLAGIAGFAIPGLNASFVFVTLVGVLAGVQGLRYALYRRDVDPAATETGDPERRHRVPAPGDELDRGAGRSDRGVGRRGRDRFGSRRRDRRTRNRRQGWGWPRSRPRTLRRRVRVAVVETIRLREHCSTEAAERLVASGAWTDDPVAARFLGADATVPLATRLKLHFARRDAYRSRAARALDALDSLRESDDSALTNGEPADQEVRQ